MQEDYTELFPASSIVYLCAESPYELPDKFEPAETSAPSDGESPIFTADDVYVIGGIVDHNHHTGLCYEQVSSFVNLTFRIFVYLSRTYLLK